MSFHPAPKSTRSRNHPPIQNAPMSNNTETKALHPKVRKVHKSPARRPGRHRECPCPLASYPHWKPYMPGTPRCKAVRPISQQRMSGIVLLRTSVRKDRSCSTLLVVLTNAQDLRCSSRFRCSSTHARTPRKHLDPSNGKDKQNAMCIQGALPGSAALTAGDRASRRSNCRYNSKAYSVSFNSSSYRGTSVR
jgi:hypothetical protein